MTSPASNKMHIPKTIREFIFQLDSAWNITKSSPEDIDKKMRVLWQKLTTEINAFSCTHPDVLNLNSSLNKLMSGSTEDAVLLEVSKNIRLAVQTALTQASPPKIQSSDRETPVAIAKQMHQILINLKTISKTIATQLFTELFNLVNRFSSAINHQVDHPLILSMQGLFKIIESAKNDKVIDQNELLAATSSVIKQLELIYKPSINRESRSVTNENEGDFKVFASIVTIDLKDRIFFAHKLTNGKKEAELNVLATEAIQGRYYSEAIYAIQGISNPETRKTFVKSIPVEITKQAIDTFIKNENMHYANFFIAALPQYDGIDEDLKIWQSKLIISPSIEDVHKLAGIMRVDKTIQDIVDRMLEDAQNLTKSNLSSLKTNDRQALLQVLVQLMEALNNHNKSS